MTSNRWRVRVVLATTVLAMARLSAGSWQPAAASELRVEWDRYFGGDVGFSEFRAIATLRQDELLVGALERNSMDAQAASTNRLVLWVIDGRGQIVRESEITKSPNEPRTNTAAIRDILPLENREALLLVDFRAGRPSLVAINGEGAQTTSREIMPDGRSVTLLKIVRGPAGGFLLIGHESFDALAVAVDASGRLLWEKRDDRGRMDLLVDALPFADGGFVLVGNSGQYDATRSGPSTVWVGRYSERGELRSEIMFPGRFGRIARAAEGGYGVVYDRSETATQEIHLKRLSPELKEASDGLLLSTGPNFQDFKIAPLGAAGFVVAGGKDGRPYVAIVDAAGRLAGSRHADPTERSIDIGSYGLALNGTGGLFIGASHIEALGKGNAKQRVRVQKVAM